MGRNQRGMRSRLVMASHTSSTVVSYVRSATTAWAGWPSRSHARTSRRTAPMLSITSFMVYLYKPRLVRRKASRAAGPSPSRLRQVEPGAVGRPVADAPLRPVAHAVGEDGGEPVALVVRERDVAVGPRLLQRHELALDDVVRTGCAGGGAGLLGDGEGLLTGRLRVGVGTDDLLAVGDHAAGLGRLGLGPGERL